MARLRSRPIPHARRALPRPGLSAAVLLLEEAYALAAETGAEVAVVVVVKPTGATYDARPAHPPADPVRP